MKKNFKFATIVAFVLPLFAACGGDEPTTKNHLDGPTVDFAEIVDVN